MRAFYLLFIILLLTACRNSRPGKRVIDNYLYRFPDGTATRRVGWPPRATNSYRLGCADYVTVNPNNSNGPEPNRLPAFASSFFMPSRLEIRAADEILLDRLRNLPPESYKIIFKDITHADRYYMGYINRHGDRKIMVFSDIQGIYTGPLPPTIWDYLWIPISINLTTKKMLFVRDDNGVKKYLAEDG